MDHLHHGRNAEMLVGDSSETFAREQDQARPDHLAVARDEILVHGDKLIRGRRRHQELTDVLPDAPQLRIDPPERAYLDPRNVLRSIAVHWQPHGP